MALTIIWCVVVSAIILHTKATGDDAMDRRFAAMEDRMWALETKNMALEQELGLLKSGNNRAVNRRQMESPVIAFSARITDHLNGLGHQNIVRFGTVISNTGKAYDNITSTFIAPENGIYVFFSNIMSEAGNGNEYIETEIVKNGDQLAEMYSGGSASFDSTSNMAVTSLKSGDHVWVRVHGPWSSNFAIHCCFSTFSGFLLGYQDGDGVIVG